MLSLNSSLKNNFYKLQQELKKINYQNPIDAFTLGQGDPSAFLPLISHLFLNYSQNLTTHLSNLGYDMFAKKDVGFMNQIYKICRDCLLYQPQLKKNQFFSMGFTGCKMMFVCELSEKCRLFVKNLEKSRVKGTIRRNTLTTESNLLGDTALDEVPEFHRENDDEREIDDEEQDASINELEDNFDYEPSYLKHELNSPPRPIDKPVQYEKKECNDELLNNVDDEDEMVHEMSFVGDNVNSFELERGQLGMILDNQASIRMVLYQ